MTIATARQSVVKKSQSLPSIIDCLMPVKANMYEGALYIMAESRKITKRGGKPEKGNKFCGNQKREVLETRKTEKKLPLHRSVKPDLNAIFFCMTTLWLPSSKALEPDSYTVSET